MTPMEFANVKATLPSSSSEDILTWAMARFSPEITVATSFSLEDIVIIDMLAQLSYGPAIFFLDTGRLHQETYETVDRIRARYGLTIQVFSPNTEALETISTQYGYHHIYSGEAARRNCCEVRKLAPLRRALAGKRAWITGLRREQAVSRTSVDTVEYDKTHGLIKINPLAHWRTDAVWQYVSSRKIPYNPLHDQGFSSIGCAPCTRAVQPGEDLRAGRWWWENPKHRECGLHHVKEEHR